ncbi:MAG TPA: PadR family transcriptional regulator [Bryobacteraceae bacterium]|jgi:DNA-binding PadR family transcriptional regulator
MSRSVNDGLTPEDFLPLHRDTFQILVSLADCDRHGYSILLDIAERSGDPRSITPSTLYSSIRRLLESGLIKELHERPDSEHDDQRRRYYRLTTLGRRVAELEARRLQRLLSDARSGGLLPKRS